jgi:hypothetical protein
MSKACERLACRSEKLALEVRSAISGSASIACCCVLFRTIEWRAVLDKSANTYVLVVAVQFLSSLRGAQRSVQCLPQFRFPRMMLAMRPSKVKDSVQI